MESARIGSIQIMVQHLNYKGLRLEGADRVNFGDPAVQFGAAGAFETIRVEAGRLHLYQAHRDRLERALEFLKLKLELPSEALDTAIARELEGFAPEASLRMRLTVGLDPEAPVGGGEARSPTRIWIEARPLPDDCVGPLGERPRYRATLYSDYIVASCDPWRRHKTTRYYAEWEARRRARLRGFDEAILINERGEVVEATAHNLFWIARGRLYTPPPSAGPLPGTFAAYVRRIARELDVETYAVAAPAQRLREADCLFLTNALSEIRGVERLDGWVFPPLAEHELGRRLVERVEATRELRGDFAPRAPRGELEENEKRS
jgi:branched-subunit amino acid aminotransferase/4-amino-4-deoxychorismate lyase